MTKTLFARCPRSSPRSSRRAPPRQLISPPAAGTGASTRRFPSARPGATKPRPAADRHRRRWQRPLAEHRRRRPQLQQGPRLERIQDGRGALARSRRDYGLFVRGSLLYDDIVEDDETARTPISERARTSRVRTSGCSTPSCTGAGTSAATTRRPRRPPGGELGREHVHPGRHQRRDQPFRRLGAARARLGIARGLPAAGNAEGRLRASPTT